MEIPLRHITVEELADMFRKNRNRSIVSYLFDKKTITRAHENKEIPVLTRSAYRSFQRTGDRQEYERGRNKRRQAMSNAYLAVWLGRYRSSEPQCLTCCL